MSHTMAARDLADYRRAGWRVRYRARVASTNDLALEAGRAGAPERLAIVADEQSAGRGRLDRRWDAPAGTCLLLSLLFRPPDPFAHSAPRVTMLCGLAMAEAAAALSGVDVRLKWPNDLIVEDDGVEAGSWRKLAGMLSEVGLHGESPAFVVVGLGVNVNVPPARLPALAPNATSLLAERGAPVDRVALLDTFLARAEALYAGLRRGEDPFPRWRAWLAWLGQPVQVRTPTERVSGVAEGVDADGALRLRLSGGELRRFAAGDVSLRRDTLIL